MGRKKEKKKKLWVGKGKLDRTGTKLTRIVIAGPGSMKTEI